MSDLHKKNLEAHLLQASLDDSASLSMPSVSTAQGISSCSLVPQQYRDRAKERRNLFGLDPSGRLFLFFYIFIHYVRFA
ncbi:hypothetical protein WUBG_18675 [Wuchereria bancrofti]|uniref:Uncharacterized protein n=1 Tax=Wuchereria bancrofti TaxID=6293 RepID=J9E0I2_WUCBA|nr:hypothetical protein WUBG_18675 [Wuchereria bancrofti]